MKLSNKKSHTRAPLSICTASNVRVARAQGAPLVIQSLQEAPPFDEGNNALRVAIEKLCTDGHCLTLYPPFDYELRDP